MLTIMILGEERSHCPGIVHVNKLKFEFAGHQSNVAGSRLYYFFRGTSFMGSRLAVAGFIALFAQEKALVYARAVAEAAILQGDPFEPSEIALLEMPYFSFLHAYSQGRTTSDPCVLILVASVMSIPKAN
jgi:hypothetical protein